MDQTAAGVLEPEVQVDAPRLSRPRFKNLSGYAIGGLSLALWLGLWQLASTYEWNFFFRLENIPAPSEVAAAAGELVNAPKFTAHVGNSLRRIFIGYGIAATLAIGVGLLIG